MAAPRLCAELIALLDEMRSWSDNPAGAFERVAEQFYRETGFIAPGKSVPMEMAATQHNDLRQRAYEAWHLQRRELRHKTILDAAEAISAMYGALSAVERGQLDDLPPEVASAIQQQVSAAIAKAESR